MNNNLKYLFIVISIVAIVYSQNTTNEIGHAFYSNRIETSKKSPKIYDISYKYMPDYSNSKVLEIIFDKLLFVSILVYAYTCNVNLLEILLSCLVILSIRAITIRSTILPPHKPCDKDDQPIVTGGCYDKLFSGHFALVFISSLVLYKYKAISSIVLYAINTMNAVFILLRRRHYTDDIIMSFFVTLFTHLIIMPSMSKHLT
jgi:hypothetical protein